MNGLLRDSARNAFPESWLPSLRTQGAHVRAFSSVVLDRGSRMAWSERPERTPVGKRPLLAL